MVATQQVPATGGVRSMLSRRYGGVPVWAYVAGVLALLLVVAWWRAKRNAAANATATGDEEPLPGDQAAPPVFIVPQPPGPTIPVTVNLPPLPATVPPAPPGGGRPGPPGVPPKPIPSAPGILVPVAKFTTKNPPWNSTLSGIFAHFKGKTSAKSWEDIWNHPLNADLKRKRGTVKSIQPGDKVFVPGTGLKL
jgi:hypothetical protein